jgi:DNA-binding CsgD family transcriptional regulator
LTVAVVKFDHALGMNLTATGDRNISAPTPEMGVLLMDESMRPFWFNFEAARILSYPQKPDSLKALGADDLGEKIRTSLSQQPLRSPSLSELTSGRRRYLCRAFALELQGKGTGRGPNVAVLLERSPRGMVTLATMSGQLQLTRREQETLELLSIGLDTKEIADCMHISTNTTKVYIRMVMAKMGVSSRSEVLAKVLSKRSSPGPKESELGEVLRRAPKRR